MEASGTVPVVPEEPPSEISLASSEVVPLASSPSASTATIPVDFDTFCHMMLPLAPPEFDPPVAFVDGAHRLSEMHAKLPITATLDFGYLDNTREYDLVISMADGAENLPPGIRVLELSGYAFYLYHQLSMRVMSHMDREDLSGGKPSLGKPSLLSLATTRLLMFAHELHAKPNPSVYECLLISRPVPAPPRELINIPGATRVPQFLPVLQVPYLMPHELLKAAQVEFDDLLEAESVELSTSTRPTVGGTSLRLQGGAGDKNTATVRKLTPRAFQLLLASVKQELADSGASSQKVISIARQRWRDLDALQREHWLAQVRESENAVPSGDSSEPGENSPSVSESGVSSQEEPSVSQEQLDAVQSHSEEVADRLKRFEEELQLRLRRLEDELEQSKQSERTLQAKLLAAMHNSDASNATQVRPKESSSYSPFVDHDNNHYDELPPKPFRVGDCCTYTDSNGQSFPAEVIGVHVADNGPTDAPYYSVMLPTGERAVEHHQLAAMPPDDGAGVGRTLLVSQSVPPPNSLHSRAIPPDEGAGVGRTPLGLQSVPPSSSLHARFRTPLDDHLATDRVTKDTLPNALKRADARSANQCSNDARSGRPSAAFTFSDSETPRGADMHATAVERPSPPVKQDYRRASLSNRFFLDQSLMPPSEMQRLVIFMVMTVYDLPDDDLGGTRNPDDEPALTTLLVTPQFYELVVSNRPTFSMLSTSLTSMPKFDNDGCTALVDALRVVYPAADITTITTFWGRELVSGARGIFRINVRLPDGTRTISNAVRKLFNVHSYNGQDPFYATELATLSATAELCNAATKVSAMIDKLTAADRNVALTVYTTLVASPFAVAPNTPQPSRLAQAPSSGVGANEWQYRSKRPKWHELPFLDMAKQLPDAADDPYIAQDHHYAIMVFLGKAASTWLPALINEERPYRVFMEAVIHKMSMRVSSINEDTVLSGRLHLELDSLAVTSSAVFAEARNLSSLTDAAGRSMTRRIMSLIGKGLCSIRAILARRTCSGMAHEEATWLLRVCNRDKSAESSESFLARMDRTYTRCVDLWGANLAYETFSSGTLNQLLPLLVRDLHPPLQSKAIEWWNKFLRRLVSAEAIDAMPPQYVSLIQPALDEMRRRRPVRSDINVLGEVMAGDPRMFDALSRVVSEDAGVIEFNGAEDLDWLSKVGLTMTLWQPFMSIMYTRTTSVYLTSTTTFAEMAAASPPRGIAQISSAPPSEPQADADCVDDEEGLIAGVQFKGKPQPAKHATKVAFGQGAADDTSSRLDTIEKDLAKFRVGMEQMREQSIHATETIVKQLSNLAGNTTDLKHATAIRKTADEQRARALEATRRATLHAMAERRLRNAIADGAPGAKSKWKLEDKFPPLKYHDLSASARTALANGLGIVNEDQFVKAGSGDEECQVCGRESFRNDRTSPHRVLWCPLLYASKPESATKLSASARARSAERVNRLNARSAIKALLECAECDGGGGVGGESGGIGDSEREVIAVMSECFSDDIAALGVEDTDPFSTWLGAAHQVLDRYREDGPFSESDTPGDSM